MKLRDALGIAGRTALGKGSLLPVLGAAACVFCLCFAATALDKVHQEQKAPSELTVTAGQVKLTSSALAQLEQIPGVVTLTPVVQLPVQLTAGDYAAELTVTGLRGGYVNQVLQQGTLFAEHGAMPYLVLNEAACKQFKKKTIDFSDKETDISWLGTGVILRLSDTNSVPARVCGILADDKTDDAPVVLMDFEAAQALLRSLAQPVDPQLVYVRVQDSGTAQPVADAISKLGFAVALPDEGIQEAWAAAQKEATYLILLALLSLCFAIFQMRAVRKLSLCNDQGVFTALNWMGMREGALHRILRLQTLLVALCGCAAGLVSLVIPAILQQEVVQGTCFALPVPWWAWAGCGGVVATVFMLGTHVGSLVPKLRERHGDRIAVLTSI